MTLINPFIEANFPKNIDVLYAMNHGSHQWGFASPNSDYDLLCLSRYNDVREYADLFSQETTLSFLDSYTYMNIPVSYQVWDFKKYLQLLWQGNAQTYELLFPSEEVPAYRGLPKSIDVPLKELTRHHLSNMPREFAYNYYGLASKCYRQRIVNTGETINTKKYLYIIRPILVAYSVLNTGLPSSLRLNKLLSEHHYLVKDVLPEISEIFKAKIEDKLHDLEHSRISKLDKWIEESLEDLKLNIESLPKYNYNTNDRREFKYLFRQLITF